MRRRCELRGRRVLNVSAHRSARDPGHGPPPRCRNAMVSRCHNVAATFYRSDHKTRTPPVRPAYPHVWPAADSSPRQVRSEKPHELSKSWCDIKVLKINFQFDDSLRNKISFYMKSINSVLQLRVNQNSCF